MPITPNKQGTHEEREEDLSSDGVRVTDTSNFEVSDMHDIEFHWENPELEMDAIFRSGIDTHLSLSAFDDLEMRSTGNPYFSRGPGGQRVISAHELSL